MNKIKMILIVGLFCVMIICTIIVVGYMILSAIDGCGCKQLTQPIIDL